MKRNLDEITNKEFDVVIVGGGMFGVCAAWEAAQRGLSAALIERGDFCQATSANHFKMVHGGIRYLQHGDIYRIRESSRERSSFLRIAPHLVQPLPIVIPAYGHGMKGKEILGAGMFLYDVFTADRNRGISDPARKIPRGRFISKKEVMELFPGVKSEGLTGAAVFCDAQMYNPPRLALSFLLSAVDSGAAAANYLEVFDFIRQGDKICGVKARDVFSGDEVEVRGKFVLNTAGPWAANLLENSMGIEIKPKPAFSRDAAFVVKRKPTSNNALTATLKTKDVDAILDRGGRHVFIVPWIDREYTLIGVWHIVWGKDKDNIYVTEKELQGFIDEVTEAYPGLELSLNDVSMVNTGLTLFGESKPGSTRMSFGKRSRLVDHEKTHSIQGIFTLIGVRATVARGMAEKVIGQIASRIGKTVAKSTTEKTPLYGGNIENFGEMLQAAEGNKPAPLTDKSIVALAHNHGSEYHRVLEYLEKNPEWGTTVGKSHVLKAEIIHAIRREMAVTLSDIVFRRTDLGTAGDPGMEAIKESAELMANELNWTANHMEHEIDQVKEKFRKHGSVKIYNPEYQAKEVVH
ncbi:MAG: FAD-dependent oxidoreductase [Calditrichia bacterium]